MEFLKALLFFIFIENKQKDNDVKDGHRCLFAFIEKYSLIYNMK